MADLADELLADLGPEQDQEASAVDASGNGSLSEVGKGKRKAQDFDDADLDDLEALEGGEDDEEETEADDGDADGDAGLGDAKVVGAGATNPGSKKAVKAAEEMDQDQIDQLDLNSVDSIHSISRLLRSSRLQGTLTEVDKLASQQVPDLEGVLEETPEYALIVKANNIAVEVDNEIMLAHKFIRDHYAPRFPELETLILNPWEFVRAVQALGNEEDMSKASMEGILPHGTIVVISMTASTTSGKPLPPNAWARVQEASSVVFELETARRKILSYVESRMTLIAPNLSAVIGIRVATKLLGVAGGLNALSKIPACNIGLLGAPKKAATIATGLSTAFSGRFSGFVAQSQLVENTPEEYKRQAQRMVSAKAVLAARMDAAKSIRDGSYGRKLYEELEKKIEKLQEPPPSKLIKALPVPSEGGRKQRRGGRLARKRKEMYGMTDLRKMQNRVEFGKEQVEVGAFDDVVGMGMIGAANSGKVRASVAEDRSRAKMSKRNINRLAQLRGPSSSTSAALDAAETSGTATSLAFTPVQGIELAVPTRKAKVDEANAKWFKEGQFSLLPGVSGTKIPGASSMAPPSLPAAKKE